MGKSLWEILGNGTFSAVIEDENKREVKITFTYTTFLEFLLKTDRMCLFYDDGTAVLKMMEHKYQH